MSEKPNRSMNQKVGMAESGMAIKVEKARGIGISDDELNALIAVTSSVNSGVTAATARVAFGMLEKEAGECGEVCSPNPQ